MLGMDQSLCRSADGAPLVASCGAGDVVRDSAARCWDSPSDSVDSGLLRGCGATGDNDRAGDDAGGLQKARGWLSKSLKIPG